MKKTFVNILCLIALSPVFSDKAFSYMVFRDPGLDVVTEIKKKDMALMTSKDKAQELIEIEKLRIESQKAWNDLKNAQENIEDKDEEEEAALYIVYQEAKRNYTIALMQMTPDTKGKYEKALAQHGESNLNPLSLNELDKLPATNLSEI